MIPTDRKSHSLARFWATLAGAIAATAVIGWIDYITGREFGFFVFYFAPIGFVGWRLGLKSGIGLSLVSALVWALAGAPPGTHFETHLIPVWNTIIRMAAFLVIAVGSSNLRRAYDVQEKTSRDLSRALSQIKTLAGLLPICASCKKIRDESGQWQVLEAYLGTRSDVRFSHGVCPDCAQEMIREAGLPEDFLTRGTDDPD